MVANALRRAMVGSARGAITWSKWARYDHGHRIQAQEHLTSLSEQGRALTVEQRRRCRDYAHDVLGSRAYAPWLAVYTATRGEFVEGWIPDNYLGRWVVPHVTKGLQPAAGTRSLSRRLLRTDALPDVAYVVGGRLLGLEMQPLAPADLAASCPERLMLKTDRALGGAGVRPLRREELTADLVSGLDDGVLQARIDQHPALAQMSAGATTTVGIITVKEPDARLTLRAAHVTVGLPASGRASGYHAMQVPIVDGHGRLGAFGLDGHWRRFTTSPATGTALDDRHVPGYEPMVRLALDLHASVPQVAMAEWDLTVDAAGRIWLLEWHLGHPSITVDEATIGPCFAGLGWERLHLLGTHYVPGPDQP